MVLFFSPQLINSCAECIQALSFINIHNRISKLKMQDVSMIPGIQVTKSYDYVRVANLPKSLDAMTFHQPQLAIVLLNQYL